MAASKSKTCCRCRKTKPFSAFYALRSTADGRYPHCIDCYKKARSRAREGIITNRRDWEKRLRKEAIKNYGGKCRCCGEKQLEFLSVVPIPGKAERPKRGTSLPFWLRKNGWPKGFRVLCHNCRTAYERFDYCPHTRAAI